MKYDLVSLRPNYYIVIEYLKTEGVGGGGGVEIERYP